VASKYPAALDALPTNAESRTESASGKPKAGEPGGSGFHSGLHNDANDAINKIESELGLEPSGPFTSVLARFEATEACIGRRLLRKLNEGLENCSIVVVGDSTSATYATWVGKVVAGLAARFPAYTVNYRDWTDGNTDYNAASEKQKGAGSHTLTVYNSAVSGVNASYQLAPNFEAMIASKQPDLIFVSHGHNHGGNAVTAEPFFRDALTIATESILRACPLSEVVVFAQNPRTDVNAENHARRQFVAEQVAHERGFGFINMHRLFLDVDPAVSSLLADTIHPNATGYTLMANAVLAQMNLLGRINSQQPSSFLASATSYLTNGDFASFASPPTLTGWTATNTTLSKDATNFEGPNGYSVRMVTVSSASASQMLQTVAGNSLRPIRGGWATFLARVRIPVGQTGYPGRVNIVENNGSHIGTTSSEQINRAGGEGNGQGDWRWTMCSRRIAADCTNISCIITTETNGFSGDVSVDRAILVRGVLPRDIR
jgi:lysophospholipase L1-like esterase